ncbi:MAG: hypothetical protein EXX96DRAFT_557646 [Benjaminiella poitrasii]|nr:MAG: hypothetical protein EXX96DRAFT_557646 [Benjaminiella poitrasii]
MPNTTTNTVTVADNNANKPEESSDKSPVTKNETLTRQEQKVFVGNLSFSTTKESLASFAESAGKVSTAIIIIRGRRPIGYGFVTFETDEAVEKAIKDLDHKMLDGREVNVQLAHPRENTRDDDATTSHRKKKRSSVKSRRSAKRSSVTEEEKKEEEKDKTIKEEEPEIDKKEETEARDNTTKRKKRSNKKKVERERTSTEPSKTTLFIANLPYATTSEELKDKVFSSYKVVSAYVARMRHGRSKGYGFVEFEDEKEQLRALESFKDLVLDGRSIYMKIAFSEPKKENQVEDLKVKNEEEKDTNKK